MPPYIELSVTTHNKVQSNGNICEPSLFIGTVANLHSQKEGSKPKL